MSEAAKWEILVINLPSSQHRWQAVCNRLTALGVPFTRIDAVNGGQLTNTEIAEVFDAQRCQREYHYQLTRGEIGCYLSHIKAWQYVIDNNLDFAIVLEDDVVFADNFPMVPRAIAAAKEPWHVIKLAAPFKPQKPYHLDLINSFRWVSYRKPPMGACAQAISRAGAEKLLAQRPKIFRPIDVDMQWQSELGLTVRGLLPYTVDNSHVHASDIYTMGNRKLQEKRPLNRIKHQIKLYFDGLRAFRQTLPKI